MSVYTHRQILWEVFNFSTLVLKTDWKPGSQHQTTFPSSVYVCVCMSLSMYECVACLMKVSMSDIWTDIRDNDVKANKCVSWIDGGLAISGYFQFKKSIIVILTLLSLHTKNDSFWKVQSWFPVVFCRYAVGGTLQNHGYPHQILEMSAVSSRGLAIELPPPTPQHTAAVPRLLQLLNRSSVLLCALVLFAMLLFLTGRGLF